MHSENQSKGVHYAKSQRLLEINHAHLQLMESLLDEGKKHNIFKPDIDPLQVYINIAALGGVLFDQPAYAWPGLSYQYGFPPGTGSQT